MATTSSAALLLSLISLGLYAYSINYIFFKADFTKLEGFLPEPLKIYGQFKFLTIHCLIFQFINSILHVLAHFVRPLEKIRDVFFYALAYPIGSIVVYSFWAVWLSVGRELIYPTKLDEVYPSYINHFIHTIIAPINLALMFLVQHRSRNVAGLLCTIYLASYLGLLQHIKLKTGYSVYGFIDAMDNFQRVVYYAITAMFGFLVYKSGFMLNNLIHGSPASQVQRKQKQK